MKMKLNGFDYATWILLIIGGLNWGLVGIFKLDLVMTIFGTSSVLVELVYVLVGLSALYWLYKMVIMKK